MRLSLSQTGLLLIGLLSSTTGVRPSVVQEGSVRPAAESVECHGPRECPDRFAWRKFVEINAPDPAAPERLLWQGWATDADTFPSHPDPSRCSSSVVGATTRASPSCPGWPDGREAVALDPARRNEGQHWPTRTSAMQTVAELFPGVPPDQGAIAEETIHRNRVTHDYIVKHDLWYREGIAQRSAEDFRVDFPSTSVELKINWLPARYVPDPSRYFFAEVGGELHVMVAMHITTKDLPEWFWATFEHVDNPGRCDHIGCRDRFGVSPSVVAPSRELKRSYPIEELTPSLGELMREAKLAPVFRNYRLKGTQIDFAQANGEPTRLGNSVTEYGRVPTASCIACHSEAHDGRLGVDFVWAIPFKAQPIGGPPESAQAPAPTIP